MVKVISLSEEAYNLLKNMKGGKMSFSDVIVSNLGFGQQKKTENLKDLLNWINSLPPSRKKEAISTKVDEIVYGVKK